MPQLELNVMLCMGFAIKNCQPEPAFVYLLELLKQN